jgi:HSP20 family protein
MKECAMALSPFLGFDRDPFTLMRRLQDEADRASVWPSRASGFPPVNMWQGPDSAALTAELPGVDPADIDISVKDDVVTISGERKPPETDDATVWHRRERAYGRFSRVVQLPYRVDPERIEARMGDGVLQIELHRPEADKPRRIRINAN